MATRWVAGAVAGLGLLLGSGGATAQGKVQKVSKNLVERAESTLKKIEEAEKQLGKVTKRYGELLAGRSVNDRRRDHGKLRDELKDLETKTKDVRESSRDMEREASRFFGEWQKGVDSIRDTELRALSRQGLSESQQKYGLIVAAGRSVADQYDAFVTTLGNQLKYLEVDLSDQAIARLQSPNQDLRGAAKELQSRVGGLKSEIGRYVAALR